VCYYSSWTHYREGDGNFEVENIDTSLCSHIVYTFLKLDEHEVVHSDNWLDPPNGLGLPSKIRQMKFT
jgi:chitinase